MQQPQQHNLFLRLAGITKQIRDAIKADESEAVASLNREHKEIMDEIQAAGLSNDPQLLAIAQQANNEVLALIQDIEEKQRELKDQLSAHDNKKKLTATYGKFQGAVR